MVEYACNCDGLPAHSHIATGRMVPGSMIETGMFVGQRYDRIEYDPYDIRLWVDWKQVAKELIRSAS